MTTKRLVEIGIFCAAAAAAAVSARHAWPLLAQTSPKAHWEPYKARNPKPSVDQKLTDPVLTGAIDLHAHHGPDSYARQWDAFEVVKLAKERGMRGVVLKNHWTETAGLAQLVRKYGTQGIEVFGSVTLDTPVGGVNPMAVRYMADVEGQLGTDRVDADPRFRARGQLQQGNAGQGRRVAQREADSRSLRSARPDQGAQSHPGHGPRDARGGADDHGRGQAARHHQDHRDPPAARAAVHEHVAAADAGGREARGRDRDHRGRASAATGRPRPARSR